MATSKKDYALSLSIGGTEYKSSGPTPLEALSSLEKPYKLLAKGVLTVSHDGTSKTLLMQPVKLKRLFYSSRGMLEVIAKQVFSGLK